MVREYTNYFIDMCWADGRPTIFGIVAIILFLVIMTSALKTKGSLFVAFILRLAACVLLAAFAVIMQLQLAIL